MFLFSLSSSYLSMAPSMKSRPRPIQLVRTVLGMDWSLTNHQASLKILLILVNLNTSMMLFSTTIHCNLLHCTKLHCAVLYLHDPPDFPKPGLAPLLLHDQGQKKSLR